MLPTLQQWRSLSLLEKWGVVSGLATVLGIIFAVYVYLVPPSGRISVSDKVVKDDNQTKLQIDKIEIRQWVGDSEPYVTLVIKNISKRTALGVKPVFIGDVNDWYFTPTNTSSLYINGVSIEAQGVTEFPVAPVSEFLSKLQSKCPGCYLFYIGEDAKNTDQVKAKICSQYLMMDESCLVSNVFTPVLIAVRYKTIFDEKMEQRFVKFAHLTRSFPTPYQVPQR